MSTTAIACPPVVVRPRPGRRRWRLRPGLRKAPLVVHVVATGAWIGTA